MRGRIVAAGQSVVQWLRMAPPWVRATLAIIGAIGAIALYAFTLFQILDHYIEPVTSQQKKDLP